MTGRVLMYARDRRKGKRRKRPACPGMNDHSSAVPAFEDKKRAGRVSSLNVASMRPR
jgi:hypothetical protein